MIDPSTLAGLHEHRHQLAAYYPRCDRWRVLPLADLIAQGHGSRRLPMRVTCSACGSPGICRCAYPCLRARQSAIGWRRIGGEPVIQSDGGLSVEVSGAAVVEAGCLR
jgi:hypothetical protein